jgi:hypothetical protein
MMIKIIELEAVINTFKRANPAVSPARSDVLSLLVTLYGTLIYQRGDRFDLDQQTPACRRLLKNWMEAGRIDRLPAPARDEPLALGARNSG